MGVILLPFEGHVCESLILSLFRYTVVLSWFLHVGAEAFQHTQGFEVKT